MTTVAATESTLCPWCGASTHGTSACVSCGTELEGSPHLRSKIATVLACLALVGAVVTGLVAAPRMISMAACRAQEAREGEPHLQLVGMMKEDALDALGGDAVVEFVDAEAGSNRVVSTSACPRSWLSPRARGLIYLRVSR